MSPKKLQRTDAWKMTISHRLVSGRGHIEDYINIFFSPQPSSHEQNPSINIANQLRNGGKVVALFLDS